MLAVDGDEPDLPSGMRRSRRCGDAISRKGLLVIEKPGKTLITSVLRQALKSGRLVLGPSTGPRWRSLPAAPESVSRARRFAASVLAEVAESDADHVDEVILVVSELITNSNPPRSACGVWTRRSDDTKSRCHVVGGTKRERQDDSRCHHPHGCRTYAPGQTGPRSPSRSLKAHRAAAPTGDLFSDSGSRPPSLPDRCCEGIGVPRCPLNPPDGRSPARLECPSVAPAGPASGAASGV
jgi:hypothetical protein